MRLARSPVAPKRTKTVGPGSAGGSLDCVVDIRQRYRGPVTDDDPTRPRRIAVFGHANLEMVIPAGPFPIAYEPDRPPRGHITGGVSGTAYNEAITLWKLGCSATRASASSWATTAAIRPGSTIRPRPPALPG